MRRLKKTKKGVIKMQDYNVQKEQRITAEECAKILLAHLTDPGDTAYERQLLQPDLLIIEKMEYLEHKTETQAQLHKVLQQRIAADKHTAILSELGEDRMPGIIGDDLKEYLKIDTSEDALDVQRVELSIHTDTSSAVSLISPKQLIREAADRGLKAIAVTDLDSVQNFYELGYQRDMHAPDLKVIFGAQIINDAEELVTVLAKDQEGLKPLYKLISRKTITADEREHLLMGMSGLRVFEENAQERIKDYDYIMLPTGYESPDFVQTNKTIYEFGKQAGKPVVAIGDCHYLYPYEKIGKDVLAGVGKGVSVPENQHLRSTKEMLKLYSGLGSEIAYEVVITNPGKIADAIDQISPDPRQTPAFVLPNAQQEVKRLCAEKLQALYGQQPEIIQRLEAELAQVRDDTAFSLLLLCHKIIRHVQAMGAITGTRGTIGSTLIAYLLGISDINPLPAHHRCPECKHTEFAEAISGFDLPKKTCPHCGALMLGDGHNIPFETCLGVDKDMELDIDLNTTPAMQAEVRRFLGAYLGQDRLAVAGIIGTIQTRAAMTYVKQYMETTGQVWSEEEQQEIAAMITGVKRTDGVHPGGVMLLPEGMEWEDVTPLCANRNRSVTTHMECHQIETLVPKLDILSVKYYAALQEMCALAGVNPADIDYQDPVVYALFKNADTHGIPEFSDAFTMNLMQKVNAATFSDLLKVSAMAHGTNVWTENGEYFIRDHAFTELIGDRDDVFLSLRKYGMNRRDAYMLMTATRKGLLATGKRHNYATASEKKRLETLKNGNVPQWFIDSLETVHYLFPKAHGAHYTKLAVSFAWFKVYYPEIFYPVMLQATELGTLRDCSDAQLQARMEYLDRQEWSAANLLLEARQRGYAADLYPA